MSYKVTMPELGEYAKLEGGDVRVVTLLSTSIVVVEEVDSGAKRHCHPGDLTLSERAVKDHEVRRERSNDLRDGDDGLDPQCAETRQPPSDGCDGSGASAAFEKAASTDGDAPECHAGPEGLVEDRTDEAVAADAFAGKASVTECLDPGFAEADLIEALGSDPLNNGVGGVVVRKHPDLPGDLSALDAASQQIMMSRWEHIKPLVGLARTTVADVEAVANKAGVNASTVYKWLNRYRKTESILSLAPTPGGTPIGENRLDDAVEKIMADVIDEMYLRQNRLDTPYIFDTLSTRCKLDGLKPPSYATFRRRLQKIPGETVVSKRVSSHRAYEMYGPTIEEVKASAPFELVQIDHTRADVMVVEPTTGEVIGRPWVTLAIDVFSRMTAAVYVSMNPPCAASVGICIWRAMTDKSAYLRSLDIEAEWPVYGQIGRIKVDNGKDLKSRAVKLGCVAQGIDVTFRQRAAPADGAHIERLMGAVAKICARLPGKTGRNAKERKGLDPEQNACLTLRVFEQELVGYFLNVYHVKDHQGLGTKPLWQWRSGVLTHGETITTGPAKPLADPVQARFDLMPFERRTVQRYGLQMFGFRYWCDDLAPLIKTKSDDSKKVNKKYVVRFDPRDLTEVFLYDDNTNRHLLVPVYRTDMEAMSKWELKALRRARKKAGESINTEASVIDERRRSDARIAKAKANKAERRVNAKHLTLRDEAQLARSERDAALGGGFANRSRVTVNNTVEQVDDAAFDDFGDY